MILNDLIQSPTDCARGAINDPCSHLDNRVDGVKDKFGYVVVERTSSPVGSYTSLVFDQVNPSLSLNLSLNLELLRIWLSKLHFFFSSCLILFFGFGGFVDVFLDYLIGVQSKRWSCRWSSRGGQGVEGVLTS